MASTASKVKWRVMKMGTPVSEPPVIYYDKRQSRLPLEKKHICGGFSFHSWFSSRGTASNYSHVIL